MRSHGQQIGDEFKRLMSTEDIGAPEAMDRALAEAGPAPTPEDAMCRRLLVAAPWFAYAVMVN